MQDWFLAKQKTPDIAAAIPSEILFVTYSCFVRLSTINGVKENYSRREAVHKKCSGTVTVENAKFLRVVMSQLFVTTDPTIWVVCGIEGENMCASDLSIFPAVL